MSKWRYGRAGCREGGLPAATVASDPARGSAGTGPSCLLPRLLPGASWCPGNPHGRLVVRVSWVTYAESQKVTDVKAFTCRPPTQSPGPTPPPCQLRVRMYPSEAALRMWTHTTWLEAPSPQGRAAGRGCLDPSQQLVRLVSREGQGGPERPGWAGGEGAQPLLLSARLLPS